MSYALHRALSPAPTTQGRDAQLSFLESDASLMHRIFLLPKVDLHRHLTGAISARTAVRIAAKYNVSLPTYIVDELDDVLFNQERVESHRQYFAPWTTLNTLFVSLDAVHELVMQVVQDAASDNVVYMELRLGPRNYLMERGAYSFQEFIDVVADSLHEANSRFNTITKCILGIPRHVFVKFPAASRSKMFSRMLYAIRQRSDCFVGVDLNGDELAADANEFAAFFKLAREMQLPATVHAGEVGSAENVLHAVQNLGASRIGHGIAAAQSRTVLELLAKKKCVLEICPTSNKFLGIIDSYKDLPLSQLRDNGIRFAICTDNPARCRTSMSEELFRVSKSFAYSIGELKELTRVSMEVSFADEPTRRAVIAKLA